MHPAFSIQLAKIHASELARAAEQRRSRAAAPAAPAKARSLLRYLPIVRAVSARRASALARVSGRLRG